MINKEHRKNPKSFIEKTYDSKTGRLRVRTINQDPPETDQSFKDECDINNIMKKYDNRMSQVPFGANGSYADFTQLGDYQQMLDSVMRAEEAFGSLPAQIRARFGNSPHELISFLQDENNHDEGVKLGLINQRPEPQKNDDSNDDKRRSSGKNKEPQKTQSSKAVDDE